MAQIDNFFRELLDIEKRLRKLETVKQIVGADIVQIIGSNVSSGTSGSVASGAKVTFTTSIIPAGEVLTLWDLFFSFYIDTNSNAAFLYPNGASLTSAQKNLQLQWGYDYILSDDGIGKRVAKITIVNNDASAHEYFLSTKWYGIKQSV